MGRWSRTLVSRWLVGTIPDVDEALAGQIAELDEFLAGLSEEDWTRPSRCEGWSVADVALHLAQTNEIAIASAEGRFAEVVALFTAGGAAQNVDEGAAIAVERERGQPPEAVFARWRASATAMRDVLAAADPGERVTWVAGQLSVRTLTTTRLAETWIHTADVTHALGVEPAATARLWHIARLAWRTLPYAFLRAGRELSGPVAFELTGPEGEDDVWRFLPDAADTEATTRVSGPARDLCLVAARRVDPPETGLVATGPDAAAVLDLVRTYA
jgi:uncharacterized protein (TIGR03084 family)